MNKRGYQFFGNPVRKLRDRVAKMVHPSPLYATVAEDLGMNPHGGTENLLGDWPQYTPNDRP